MAGSAAAEPVTRVAVGDSLTAGYMLDPGQSFPDRLQDALRAKGYNANMIDAGVSDDTTSGGLSRLDWSVGENTDAVILELGANDALRGIAPEKTRENLAAILKRLKARGLPVLLAGMLAPPNMGPEYGVRLYPFFLDGVAANPALNLGDGMHPNKAGVDVIVKRIMSDVLALLKQAGVPDPASQ
ncbi:arylesterase [Breoghania sp.]|uniref:arylesterase n=1 Tax=Breoghania sp. TaxID=2065378 RepID=UPI00260226C1|nr:arylesterase [Breoghania sp.]MDJ0932612.1 arylesterase [Breoghania sp.]